MVANIQFLSWSSYGEVSVLVDRKLYEYRVDGAMIPGWQKMARRQPGKALNEIKRLGVLVTTQYGGATTYRSTTNS